MRKKVIFGNWKMNGTIKEFNNFIELVDSKINNDVIAGLGLPFTMLENGINKSKNLKIAAQNVHFEKNGAFTGEVSIEMLKEIGVEFVIIGHSERRTMFNETDESVNSKAIALIQNKITPIICCGESIEIYEEGKTISHINNQIEKAFKNINAEDAMKTIIAYEPIWAIGTGKTATSEIAENICKSIRTKIESMYNKDVANSITIQYGGSVSPTNIKELLSMENIDGALVGGASLVAENFIKLINYK